MRALNTSARSSPRCSAPHPRAAVPRCGAVLPTGLRTVAAGLTCSGGERPCVTVVMGCDEFLINEWAASTMTPGLRAFLINEWEVICCARSVLWTSSQPSAIMPDGCPPCDTLLAMFGANAHQWERSAMAHLVRGTAVIWHCPSSVATQRHATSAASSGNMSVVWDQSLSLSMAQDIVHASNAIFSIWRHSARPWPTGCRSGATLVSVAAAAVVLAGARVAEAHVGAADATTTLAEAPECVQRRGATDGSAHAAPGCAWRPTYPSDRPTYHRSLPMHRQWFPSNHQGRS